MTKPFLGMNFCCTGLLSAHRQQLGAQIAAMGGTLHLDLMSLVHFLVVGGRRTEKYKYSVRYRHDIAFVSPASIADLHARWVQGDDADLDIRRHLLPVFSGYVVCVARVDRPPDADHVRLMSERFRQPPAAAMPAEMPRDPFSAPELIRAMLALGADVSATLTSECAVLVGTAADGRRYRMAREWHVPVVHPLWVYDSCLRGAALHLDDYELTPGALNLYSSTLFAWKSLYLARVRPAKEAAVPERRERPLLKKTSDVWTSIMASTHPVAEVCASSRLRGAGLAFEESAADPGLLNLGLRDSILDSELDAVAMHAPALADSSTLRLFHGLTFLPVGISVPEQMLLRQVVESHLGAVTAVPDDPLITHVLLRVRDGPQALLMLLALPQVTARRVHAGEVAVVTDWFVERSVYYHALRQDAWCRPMPGLVPLLRRFRVCLSGFTGVELLHLEKLVGLLNLDYCDVFSAQRDLLVVNVNVFRHNWATRSPALFDYKPAELTNCPVVASGHRSVAALSARNKIAAAKRWCVPVVSAAYLWEIVRALDSQPHLRLPRIADPAWCIYAPREAPRASSLMEFAGQESNEEPREQREDVRVQLPSPRKSKDKHRYGRLVGGGVSLTNKIHKSSESGRSRESEPEGEPDISVNDENQTQVGYGNADSSVGDNDLWKEIVDMHDRLPKRRRTRG